MTRVVSRTDFSLKRRMKAAIMRVAVGVTFIGTTVLASAADNTPPPRDAIDATKRDFDAIKAARDSAQQQKGMLPKIGMPELQAATPEPRPLPATKSQKLDPAAKKSTNWLVDAMEKEARQRARDRNGVMRDREGARRVGGDDVSDDELGLTRAEADEVDETKTLAREGEKSASDRARDTRESSPEKTAAPNPLAQYLGEWLTPRDYAVLRPGLEESATRGGLGDQVPGIGAPSASALALGSTGLGAAIGAVAPAPPIGGPVRENPYLQALETPTAALANAPSFSPTLSPLTTLPAPLAAPSAVAPIPPPSAPVQPKIPEFAKPAQDEKYFKQLKRF